MHNYFFRYSVSSLMASGILPFALRMATRRFQEAAFVSSWLMIESSKSSASSYLNHKTPKHHHLPQYTIQQWNSNLYNHACMHAHYSKRLVNCVCGCTDSTDTAWKQGKKTAGNINWDQKCKVHYKPHFLVPYLMILSAVRTVGHRDD